MVKLKQRNMIRSIKYSVEFPCNNYALAQTLVDELKMEYESATSSQSGQLPVDSIAQLIEHCTGIADVMGSNPVQA